MITLKEVSREIKNKLRRLKKSVKVVRNGMVYNNRFYSFKEPPTEFLSNFVAILFLLALSYRLHQLGHSHVVKLGFLDDGDAIPDSGSIISDRFTIDVPVSIYGSTKSIMVTSQELSYYGIYEELFRS